MKIKIMTALAIAFSSTAALASQQTGHDFSFGEEREEQTEDRRDRSLIKALSPGKCRCPHFANQEESPVKPVRYVLTRLCHEELTVSSGNTTIKYTRSGYGSLPPLEIRIEEQKWLSGSGSVSRPSLVWHEEREETSRNQWRSPQKKDHPSA